MDDSMAISNISGILKLLNINKSTIPMARIEASCTLNESSFTTSDIS